LPPNKHEGPLYWLASFLTWSKAVGPRELHLGPEGGVQGVNGLLLWLYPTH